MAGIGLAFVIERCAAWHPAIGAAVTTAGAVAVLGAAILFDDATPFPGYLAAVPVVGTAAMIAGGASGGFTARWLGSRALTWIGDRSYGWYLWHWPVIVFLRLVAPDRPALLVAGAVGALGPAALSYRLIERPIRIAPSLNGGRLTRLAFACALVPALLAGGVLAGASVRWGIDTPPEWADQRLATRERCGDEPTVAWNEDCRFSVDDPKGVIVLIGDSQADSLSDGFVEAANRLGYDAVVWFESGCPALLGRPATYSDRCPVWQESTVELVHRLRPALVVVANLSTRYVHASDPGGAQWQAIRDAGGLPTTDRNSAVQAWTEGLGALVDEFAELDVPTLLVSVPPEYPRAFDEGTSLLRGTPDPPVITRDSMDRWRDPAVDAEATVVERRPSASVYDPAVTLCTARDCTPADAEGWWYMDNQHLNPRGSRMLVPSLVVAIESALVPIG